MPRKKRRLKNGTNPKAKPKQMVSLAKLPWNGDHGTGTAAANLNTVVVPMKNDPNRRAFKYRVNAVDVLEGKLTLRQLQAARAIQRAYARNEALSSGGELKEQVDASPKPDATIAAQVDARSALVRCMAAVRRSERRIVEGVCWYDIRLGVISREGYPRALARFRIAMSRVADHLGY